METIVAALISAILGIFGGAILKDSLDRRWQLRQEIRTENLPNYRLLKDLGYLLVEVNEKHFADEARVEKIKETLLAVGEAIYKLDFEAPPHILTLLVALMREHDKFQAEMIQLIKLGQKLTKQEVEEKKEGMRAALVKLFYAMRADAKKSNKGLSEQDVRYLLFVGLGKSTEQLRLELPPDSPARGSEKV